jgi:hypothetical protein
MFVADLYSGWLAILKLEVNAISLATGRAEPRLFAVTSVTVYAS